MSEKKQAEMDICDKCDAANISFGSCSFHYAWQEKGVLFSHKIQKESKMNTVGRQEFKKLQRRAN